MGKSRSKSSRRWLREHFDDEYVQRSQRDGYRSRAVYKLAEIDRKERLIRPGMTVVDLGAAPGGWSQYAAERVGRKGLVIALDLLEIEPLPGVTLLQGDFREDDALAALMEALDGRPVDIVLSDMAPNFSGVDSVDQPRAMDLAELAKALADDVLAGGGSLVVKLFQGEGFDPFLKALRADFGKVAMRKPSASRDRSREVYAVARNHRV